MQRKVRNWALEEEACRLRQGVHRHRRKETTACRNSESEVEILVEKLKKEPPSA